jgi:uncharacterized membrane protein
MARDDLRKLWENPESWNRFGRYHCENDPRLVVPKRLGFGWTLNWAHPLAWPMVVLVVAVVAALLLFRRYL